MDSSQDDNKESRADDEEDRGCLLCYETTESSNDPFLYHNYKTKCNKAIHKKCLNTWINAAINSNNPNAFKCAGCMTYLSMDMLLASVDGDLEKLQLMFYQYKTRLNLSDERFEELLGKIKQGRISDKRYSIIKTRITNYVRERERERERDQEYEQVDEDPRPPTTPTEHVNRIIAELDNQRSNLHILYYRHFHRVLTNMENYSRREFEENAQNIANYIFYYKSRRDGHIYRIEGGELNRLEQEFGRRTNEYYGNHATRIKFEAHVITNRNPYNLNEEDGHIIIEDTIELNTPLQRYYNDQLQQRGIRVTDDYNDAHRLSENPFPTEFTAREYVENKIMEYPFLVLSPGDYHGVHSMLRIRFYDRIIIASTNNAVHNPDCKGVGCNIMGGKRKKTRKMRRVKPRKSKRYSRR